MFKASGLTHVDLAPGALQVASCGAGAEAASKRPRVSPDFSNLDSTPVRVARRKPPLAAEKTAPVALLGSPQHPAPARQLPNVVQGRAEPATQEPPLDAMTAAKEDVVTLEAEHEVRVIETLAYLRPMCSVVNGLPCHFCQSCCES